MKAIHTVAPLLVGIFFLFPVLAKAQESYFDNCQGRFSMTLPFNFEKWDDDIKNYEVSEACAPDTLYSWQFLEAVTELAVESRKRKILPPSFFKESFPKMGWPEAALYTWRTPVGTFGYGDTMIRIKLKKKVNFVYKALGYASNPRDCAQLLKQYGKNNVFVINGLPIGNFNDYLLCDDSPIESWSYHRKEQLAEMRYEIEWLKKHGTKRSDIYYRDDRDPTDRNPYKLPWVAGAADPETSWTKENLEYVMSLAEQKQNEGEIFVIHAQDEEKAKAQHFKSVVPSYYNLDFLLRTKL